MFTAVTIQDAAGADVALFDATHKLGESHGLHGIPAPRRVTRTRPGAHGEINETRHYASRQPVWNGMLVAADESALWTAYDLILKALWGSIDTPRLLKWTRADGKLLQSWVKLGDAFDPVLRASDAGHALAYQLIFDREDPRNYAQVPSTGTGASISDVGGGFGFPFGMPFGFTPSGSGSVTAANAGTIDTPATFTILGAVSNPQIQQQSTGKLIVLSGDLAAGSTYTVSTAARTVTLDGTADRGNLIDFAATDWTTGLIPPGGDTFKLLATAWDASARLDVSANAAYA
jgi:hypothetical protein